MLLALTLITGALGVCPPPGFDTQGALDGGFDIKWYANGKNQPYYFLSLKK